MIVQATKRRVSYGLAEQAGRGGYNRFYRFKLRKRKGFKSFPSREDAEIAYNIQSELSMHDLAPRVFGDVVRVNTLDADGRRTKTDWGYVTEIAQTIDETKWWNSVRYARYIERQQKKLKESITQATGMYFNDCHRKNVGWVRRNGKRVFVCIDTGPEGFD